ncbi:anti-sigma factor antagonist [Paracraurococcus ruber]|nr:anti-sigma factor antagonist [Paracraurococcus ruber]
MGRLRATPRAARPAMQIETRKVYDVLVVDIAGRLDSRSAGEGGDRLAAIAQGPDRKVVLNLAAMEYVSSAGLRALLRCAKLLQAHGGALRLCAANAMVADVLESSGFNSLLQVHAAEKDAVAAFG